MATLNSLYKLPCRDSGIGHICRSICARLDEQSMSVRLFTPKVDGQEDLPFAECVLGPVLSRIPFRFIRAHSWRRLKARILAAISPGDVAYLFSADHDIDPLLREKGIPVVREVYNCHQATARRILTEASSRLGIPVPETPSKAAADRQAAGLRHANYVFAPSDLVAQSLIENGVESSRIIRTSYGWEPSRLAKQGPALPEHEGLTVLFVGLACVRKGMPWLLKAWSRAGIRGRLILVGGVDSSIRASCAEDLARNDVFCMGYMPHPGPVYRSADVFVLPSLEEGSPLVTYEAMASGLPSITSPMGSGGIVRDGTDGFILETYDLDQWVGALRKLDRDAELRKAMGAAAQERSREFTWERTAARRRESLVQRFGQGLMRRHEW